MSGNLTTVERRREQNRLAQRRFREKHGARKAREHRQNKSPQPSNGGPPQSGATSGFAILPESPSLSFPASRDGSPSDFGDFSMSRVTDVAMDNNFDFPWLSSLEPEWNYSIGALASPESQNSDHIDRVCKKCAHGKSEMVLPALVQASSDTQQLSICASLEAAASGEDSKSRFLTVSPLHMAAKQGHCNIVRILLDHDADCNLQDQDGQTPLVHATIRGYEDVADLLLSHGASLRYVDNQHRSALHWAVMHQRDRLLRKYLKHCTNDGTLVNSYTKAGRTALHIAIQAGFEAGVELLLKSGASVQAKAPCDDSSNNAKQVEDLQAQELD
ncbi:hypothetical protein PFICI_07951 [Pestalotiopsis fici W106-1]|uniref:BZIP domain-containing protein n=1 Tax=Pestalotiopsis fici (strain W106-1 / CGMCC3.15140) TaxID=1229662 RepID=W3X4U8_PESFW|nr:uncharacterized protein PFICI_07951 [Pestalotiopsis fici W106-1]ETS80422.1 hypothetical protein PFICI_07951 [Pestalotiopsis fici W106-1]